MSTAVDRRGEAATGARDDMPTTFQLVRARRIIAFGIEWPSGLCSVWVKAAPGDTQEFPDSRDVVEVYCADDETQIVWTGQPRWDKPPPLRLI